MCVRKCSISFFWDPDNKASGDIRIEHSSSVMCKKPISPKKLDMWVLQLKLSNQVPHFENLKKNNFCKTAMEIIWDNFWKQLGNILTPTPG